jgi:hypothetical protein
MARKRQQERARAMMTPKPNFKIFWKELQAVKYGEFCTSANFIDHVRALSPLCRKHRTDDLFLAIYREYRWSS